MFGSKTAISRSLRGKTGDPILLPQTRSLIEEKLALFPSEKSACRAARTAVPQSGGGGQNPNTYLL